MNGIFVSYSKADREWAFEIVERLEARGLSCWIAPRDIAPAADWASEIMDAIAASRLMLLVFSASSNASPQVRREVERAIHRQLEILTFRIDDVAPSKSMEYFLSSQHWLDAFGTPREATYARLCDYLTARSKAAPGVTWLANLDLRPVESVLAGYIGPLAKLLVKRAAAQAGSSEDLIGRLAGELDAEVDRLAFTQRCRQALR